MSRFSDTNSNQVLCALKNLVHFNSTNPKVRCPQESIRESCMVPNEVCEPVVSTSNSTHNFVIGSDQKLLNRFSNCESQIAISRFRFDVETQMLGER